MKSVEDIASGCAAGAGSIPGALWNPVSAEPGCSRQPVQWLQWLLETWLLEM